MHLKLLPVLSFGNGFGTDSFGLSGWHLLTFLLGCSLACAEIRIVWLIAVARRQQHRFVTAQWERLWPGPLVDLGAWLLEDRLHLSRYEFPF